MPARRAPNESPNPSDIFIAGGGVVGLTCALALAGEGLSVTLAEARPQPKKQSNDIRAFAIARSGLALFDSLGLSAQMKDFLSPIWDMRIVEAHPLRGVCSGSLHLSANDIGEETEAGEAEANKEPNKKPNKEPKPIGAIIEANKLLALLRQACRRSPAIKVLQGFAATDFTAGEVDVEVVLRAASSRLSGEFAVKPTLARASLLIACDGRESVLRSRAEIPCSRLRYGQDALVCVLAHERAHRGVAIEWFMPSGTLASLPMLGDRSGIVWCDAPPMIARAAAMNEREFMRHVRVRFGDWLGKLRLVSPRYSYALSLCHAERYGKERFLLLGDAAHAIHPLAGQGLNLGLRDIALLSKTLRTAIYLGADIAAAAPLERYQRERRADNSALVFATHGLQLLFCNDNALLRAARTRALAAIDCMPLVKKHLIQSATGL